DQLLQPVRNVLARAGQIPGQRNDEGEQEIRDRYAQGYPRLQHSSEPLRSPERTPGAEHEQQLPGERIEEPVAFGIARQIPVEVPGEHVEQYRSAERKRSSKLQQPQDRRK